MSFTFDYSLFAPYELRNSNTGEVLREHDMRSDTMLRLDKTLSHLISDHTIVFLQDLISRFNLDARVLWINAKESPVAAFRHTEGRLTSERAKQSTDSIWLTVPQIAFKTKATRDMKAAKFATHIEMFPRTIPQGRQKRHALVDPDDFIVWQLARTLVGYVSEHANLILGGRIMSAAFAPLMLTYGPDDAWLRQIDHNTAFTSLNDVSSAVYNINRTFQKMMDEAIVENEGRPRTIHLNTPNVSKYKLTHDELKATYVSPRQLAWRAVEACRAFRGDAQGLDAEALIHAEGMPIIEWLNK